MSADIGCATSDPKFPFEPYLFDQRRRVPGPDGRGWDVDRQHRRDPKGPRLPRPARDLRLLDLADIKASDRLVDEDVRFRFMIDDTTLEVFR